MALDIKILDGNNKEVDLKETLESDDNMGLMAQEESKFVESESNLEGFDVSEPEVGGEFEQVVDSDEQSESEY